MGSSRLPITASRAPPCRDAIFVAQLQDFISFLNLRGDDGRFSINGHTLAGHRDCVVGFDL
jgi:hypothetical protein